MMTRLIRPFIVLIASLLLAGSALAAKRADHVLIISIDGLRPDLLLRANTPTLHALLPESTFTFWARVLEATWWIHSSEVKASSPPRPPT